MSPFANWGSMSPQPLPVSSLLVHAWHSSLKMGSILPSFWLWAVSWLLRPRATRRSIRAPHTWMKKPCWTSSLAEPSDNSSPSPPRLQRHKRSQRRTTQVRPVHTQNLEIIINCFKMLHFVMTCYAAKNSRNLIGVTWHWHVESTGDHWPTALLRYFTGEKWKIQNTLPLSSSALPPISPRTGEGRCLFLGLPSIKVRL